MLCGKLLETKTGGLRGKCVRPFNHHGLHGNSLCYHCGVVPKIPDGKHGVCLSCHNINVKKRRDRPPLNVQILGASHTFPCGCSGILPKNNGEQSLFAITADNGYSCRVSCIISSSRVNARGGNFAPVNPKTPHFKIREMMQNEKCWRCQSPMSWNLGRGLTPHLHHDHETGEAIGFTHPRCNPRLLEHEVEKLKAILIKLGVNPNEPF